MNTSLMKVLICFVLLIVPSAAYEYNWLGDDSNIYDALQSGDAWEAQVALPFLGHPVPPIIGPRVVGYSSTTLYENMVQNGPWHISFIVDHKAEYQNIAEQYDGKMANVWITKLRTQYGGRTDVRIIEYQPYRDTLTMGTAAQDDTARRMLIERCGVLYDTVVEKSYYDYSRGVYVSTASGPRADGIIVYAAFFPIKLGSGMSNLAVLLASTDGRYIDAIRNTFHVE